MRTPVRTLAALGAAVTLAACPPAGDKPAAGGAKAPAPAAAKAPAPAPAAAKTPAPAAGTPPPAAKAPAAAAEFEPPAGVKHVANPKWEDKEASTDVPAMATDGAKAAWDSAAGAYDRRVGEACKAGAASVVRLDGKASRVGYESYKNGSLPVKGALEDVRGYAVLGAKPELHVWANALTVNSGDPIRDARLKKLFFEIEIGDNGVLSFDSTAIKGLPPDGKLPETGKLQIDVDGQLKLHGLSAPLSLPLLLEKQTDGTWKASLAAETLLQLEPFSLVAPLKQLMVACNHKSMGAAVKLEFDLALKAGCEG